MARADWSTISGAMVIGSDVAAGISSGDAKPNGGGTFSYVAKSLSGAGVFAVRATPEGQADFDPMTKGGIVSAALKASEGAMPFIFQALSSTSLSGTAYTLGLDATGRIRFRKTTLDGTASMVVIGTRVYAPGTWVHLQLECVANMVGDVVINCWVSDLDAHPVTGPVWGSIDGFVPTGGSPPGALPSFVVVDDPAEINTGSAPLIGGRAGRAAWFTEANQFVGFDHFHLDRQV